MNAWLLYSLLTIAFWGCMGFLGKLASRSLPSRTLPLLGALGGLVVFPAVLVLFRQHLKLDWHGWGCYVGLLAGMIGAAGTVAFYAAVARGEASRVVAITATYPLLTLLLSRLFLHEDLSVQKIVGVALTVLGVCLLSLK